MLEPISQDALSRMVIFWPLRKAMLKPISQGAQTKMRALAFD